MASKMANNFILIFSIILISTTKISGFNITKLLDNYPDFSQFNQLLSKTGVAGAINARKTITVLVVANSDLSDLTSKPESSMKNILATHVILDYYDTLKLGDLSKKTSLLTNLYQTSGVANKEQGFLNVTKSKSGEVVFGSAIKGAPHDSKMVKSVAAQPYNISVIQISRPILAPGLDPNSPIHASSPEDAPSPKGEEEEEEDEEEKEEEAEAESPEEEAEGPTEEEAEGPTEAETPTEAPEPAAADKEPKGADESEPKLAAAKNAGSRVAHMGGAMVVATFMVMTLVI